MKNIVFVLMALSFFSVVKAQELHVMTFNIRLNVSSDSANAWPFRKDLLASEILYHDIHLLGVQEALHDQMVDLKERLPQFKYVGVGRDDGKEKGEYSAIFYDTAILTVLKSETFWLSQTPSIAGSKGWDAAITRVVTWAQFKDKRSKKIFYAFNTHFDHIGQIARKESALLVLQKVKEIAGTVPVIFTGDFNSKPSDEPIKIITDPSGPLKLTDTKEVSVKPHYGPTGTFNAFQPKERDDQPIDYIFIKNGWSVLKHATISQSWDGRFASDHFAVLATLVSK